MSKNLTFEEFNIKVVESVGLKTDDAGNILTARDKNVTKDGLKLVIPTKANINNQNEIVDDEIKPKHTLFNPYSEDEIKRNHILVILMKYMSAISTSAVLEGVLRQTIELLSTEEDIQDSVSTHVKNFIIKLREVNGSRGVLMSKKRIADMNKIINYLVEKNLYIIDYKLARGETINGIKYTRICKLNPAALEKIESDYESIGIDEKSKNIFVAIIEFIIPNIADKMVGSTSLRYPSMTVAMDMYNEVQGRINFLLEDMKEVLYPPYEALTMPLVLDTNIDRYKNDIEYMPNQNSLDTSIPVQTKTNSSVMASLQDRLVEQNSHSQQPSYETTNKFSNQHAASASISVVEDDPLEAYRASLYGAKNESGFINRHNTNIIQQTNQNQNNGFFNQGGGNGNVGFTGFGGNNNGFGNNNNGFTGFNNKPNIWG